MKHTPGPWIANTFMVVAPNGQRHHGTYGGLQVAHTGLVGNNKPAEQAIADAKLIAAAPDLLTALEAAYETFYDKRCELGLQVAAAISKATGKPVDEIAT
jgi:hypothetical protein